MASDTPAPLVAGSRLAGYELLEPLGSGGTSLAWRARRADDEACVVLKLLRPDRRSARERARLLEEGRLLRSLEHPHVLGCLDVVEDAEGWTFLVLPDCAGGSLRELAREAPLELEHAFALLRQALSGLDYLHRRGLVHRDVTPQNLLLDASRTTCLLADLGQARRELEGVRRAGTEGFRPPEQDDLDASADVYGAGATLHWLLTHRRVQHTPDGVPLLDSRLPAPFLRVLARCVAAAPARRYASAGELRRELDRAMHEVEAAD